MGKVNTASWFAIGIKQSINKKESFTSATYFGSGRISNPDNYNFFNKQSIYVLNEEISHRFKKNWKYALAISYRWQNKFKPTHPYELDTPKARQELRLYGRFYYLNSYKILDYSFSYRPEIRFFYNPDFKSATESTQFRSRIRAKGSFNLNALKTRRIIISSEFLFSTTKTINWSKFEYQETRFCLYYSLIFPSEKIRLNFGYMNQLVGKKTITDAHYLAFDIILKNPF